MGNEELKLPTVQSSEIVFNDFIRIRKDVLHYSNGQDHRYFTIEAHRPNAVVVLCQTEEGKFILNEEYRHPTTHTVLSLPGGFLEGDESPLEGAQRELLEETGYTAEHFAVIGETYPFPGLCNQKLYVVKASVAKRIATPVLEQSEVLKTVLLTQEEVQAVIKARKPIDGILVQALYFFNLNDKITKN